jgi:hypothetical protein
MPAHKLLAPHGTVRRYRQGGCDDLRGGKVGSGERCDACKLAMREFGLAKKNGQSYVKGNVTPLRAVETSPETSRQPSKTYSHGQASMEAEIMSLAEQYPDRGVELGLALSLVPNIFDPDRASQRHQNVKELGAIIERIRGSSGKKKSRGKLASVQAMSGRRTARSG